MPDERDKYVPKHSELRPTPVGGVPTVKDPAEEHTDLHPVVSRTKSDRDVLDTVARRSGETKNVALDARAAATTTLDRVNQLDSRVEQIRRENREEVKTINREIGKLNTAMTAVLVEQGKQGTQNDLIIGMLKEHREEHKRTAHEKTTLRLAEVEVDKERRLTDIELEAEHRKAEIKSTQEIKAAKVRLLETVGGKVIAGISAVVGALVTGAILGKGCL